MTLFKDKNFSREKFIDFVISRNILQIRKTTLKNGSESHVFFNFGVIDNGVDLAILGKFFADYIRDNYKDYDVLYGPAYKGIPLVMATSIALYNKYDTEVKVLYNRKEEKDHGEKGDLIGSWETGARAIILDDVITDCGTKYEVIKFLTSRGIVVKGILVGIDREGMDPKEKLSYSHVLYDSTGISVLSLCTKSDILR